ncbi:MAG: U32 family peptidase, partial [Syntrophomonadaceae bacterium]|nr:U32 family peptidase [Syntrophomonadaceae bacterium]
RGRCAGPCRLLYDLYKDANKLDLKDKGNYYLSPADLCGIHLLRELKTIGIDSLKIEGRMKRAEYVAIVTNAYRKAIDELEGNNIDIQDLYNNLTKVFNRNFSTGYLVKGNEAKFLSTLRPDNRGVYIGKVIKQDRHFNTEILLDDELNLGDGIEIWGPKDNDNTALIVNEIRLGSGSVDKAEKGHVVTLKLSAKVNKNDLVYKNYDKALFDKALKTISEDDYKIDVDISLSLKKGEYAKLVITDDMGNCAEEMGQIKAEPAQNRPLDEATAKSKVARLGDTPFRMGNFTFSNIDNVLVPFSDLNDTRRRACKNLLEKRLNKIAPSYEELSAADFRNYKNAFLKLAPNNQDSPTKLSVFVCSIEDAQLAVKAGADIVYVGLEGISTHKKVNGRELLEVIDWAQGEGTKVIASLPKIQKPTDPNLGEDLLKLGYKEFMAGNLGALNWCRQNNIKVTADYTLNFFNPYALRYIIEKDIDRVCLSPELTLKQMAKFPDLTKAELLVHGDLILMTSQYCMLSGVLSTGEKPCQGRICRKNNYYLQDDKGFRFPVVTDAYCRFYVLNSRTLCMIEDLHKLIKLKPYALRIEAHRLKGEQLTKTISIYRQALEQINNKQKPDLLGYKKELESISNSSFTKGHYYRGVL